jgi:N6-adenosine-specific RNA methylase IME4
LAGLNSGNSAGCHDGRAELADARELPWHPIASLFPLLTGAEFEEFVADVRGPHGVREKVWIYQGQILDGRNRARAAAAAGVPCPAREYVGDDPVGFVVSLNLKRRHLSESQRAMVAARLATLRDGQRADLVEGLPIGRASQLLNVGERSVARAREVHESGAPELVEAVERGHVSVSAAADIASQPLDAQREIVARGEREILRAAAEIRARKTGERRAERLARVAAQADAGPLPCDRKYPLVLADPPWRFEFSQTSSRAVEQHYETMLLEDICALPVGDLAAPIALLVLLVPSAILEEAFEVIRRWGFTYRTAAVWRKTDGIGQGWYFRQEHEFVLLATRGSMPPPHESARPPSVFEAARGEHSQKPEELYALIERMYPDLPKIELFARSRRPGWDRWGNEAPPATNDEAQPPADDGLGIPGFLDRTRRAVS